MEKLVHFIAIALAVFFALLTGVAWGHLHYEQAIRFGSAGIVLLVVALIGVFGSEQTDDSTAQNNPLHGSGLEDRS